MLVLLLIGLALILSIISVVESPSRNWTGFAVLALAVALLVSRL